MERAPAAALRVSETTLRGRRVWLREPLRSDQSEFVALMKQSRRLHRGRVEPPRDRRAFGRYLAGLGADRREGFLVCRREDGAILGVVNLNEISRGPAHTAFLGYYLGAPHTGQGYMGEALGLLQRHAFRTLRLHRLEADIQPDNTASIQLVERCGFRPEGTMRRFLKIGGRWRDHLIFARLAEEWRKGLRRGPARPEVQAELCWNPGVDAAGLDRLRAAAGWDPLGARAHAFLGGLFASVAAFGPRHQLLGWCGIVSDGAQHAFLVDVMVDRRFQDRGVGTRLVRFAVEGVRQRGVQRVHVDFVPERVGFYARCGFRVGLGGILQG
ncbi:MAG: GNAT family N-acetyltransferase, partial [Myxococcota bacterium]